MEYIRGVMDRVNPKLGQCHKNIELTRTRTKFSLLPEVSTEELALMFKWEGGKNITKLHFFK